MRNKNLIAFIIVLALAIIAIYLVSNYKTGTIKTELKDFAVKDTASIDKIFLADKMGHQSLLERQPNGKWTVNGKHTARTDGIKTLLYTIGSLQVDAPVAKAAFNNIIKDLSSAGTKVEIYQKGEKVKTYYVGGATQDNLGTYMMIENSSAPFIIRIPGFEGYLTTRYMADENSWKTPEIFAYTPEQISKVKVEYPKNPQLSFEIILHNANSFSVKSLQTNTEISNPDTLAIKNYLLGFKKINYEAPLTDKPKSYIDSVLAQQPMHIVTVTEKDGKTKSVRTFAIKVPAGSVDYGGKPIDFDVDRMFAQINDNRELIIAQFFVFDKILKPIDLFKSKGVVKK